MVPLDSGVHSEHVQVTRCDIKPGSVEIYIVKNWIIPEKNPRVFPFAHFQTPLYFVKFK
jgi:hypothetical protein